MGQFVCEEFRFVLDGFTETSTQIVADVDGPRASIGIAVTRAKLVERELPDFVDEQIALQKKTFPGLAVLAKTMGHAAGVLSADVRLRTRVRGAMLYHRIACFDWFGTVVMFTATAPMRLRDEADARLDAMVESIRFRKPRVETP